jgi:hypothetical protein
VRQGLHFLRAELPGILAKRTDDLLSPRMLRVGAATDAFGSADVGKQSPVLRATLFFTLVLPPRAETAADCWIAAPLSFID